jgi:hypothetical protein
LLRNGLKFELLYTPVQRRKPFQPVLAQPSMDFMDGIVKEYLEREIISDVTPLEGREEEPGAVDTLPLAYCAGPPGEDVEMQPYYSAVFTAPKPPDTFRPIFDGRGINLSIKHRKFKMEGLHTVKDILREGDWMGKVDLKDAYFHLPVHKHHRPLLRFRWRGRLYQYNALPFGVAPAPRIFSKLMRVVAAYLRKQGIRCVTLWCTSTTSWLWAPLGRRRAPTPGRSWSFWLDSVFSSAGRSRFWSLASRWSSWASSWTLS